MIQTIAAIRRGKRKEVRPMVWTWHFFAACAIIAVAVLLSLPGRANALRLLGLKRKTLLSPLHFCMIGVFLSAFILLVPVYRQELADQESTFLRSLISSAHQAFQMFTLDADRDIVMRLSVQDVWQSRCAYWILAAELIVAPLLTFAFVISFFEDFMDTLRFRLSRKRCVYVFSELNERSLALAGSAAGKGGRGNALVFAGVTDKEDGRMSALIGQARELRAILLKKDILSIRCGTRKKLYLFAIGDSETANQIQSLRLIDQYRDRKNTWLYVFSSRVECELLLNQKDTGRMTVRRISPAQSLIYSHLYREGGLLFRAADQAAAEAGQPVSAHCLVIGLGQYGAEMLKALSWFGQMPGYRLEADAYDIDPQAEERFAARCPELMSEAHNRTDLPGDACYRIRIHAGVDAASAAFEEELRGNSDVCYAFVALGSDEANIRTAVALRTLFAGVGACESGVPIIETVVCQADEIQAINTAQDQKAAQDHDSALSQIRFINGADELYAVDTVMQSDLEREAVQYHAHWAKTDEEMKSANRKLYRYGYYYRSSCSAVIHANALVGVLRDQGVTAGQLDARKAELNCLEHRRWNAYMRSEGYRYAKTTNRLAKLHSDLVPFDQLADGEKEKDDYLQFIKKLMKQRSGG